MSDQKTFHLLVVVMKRHNDHKTWGGNWWDWWTHFPWTASSNILVHLGMTRTNTGESLIKEFNASDSYQSVGKPLEPHQNPHSWAMRCYRRSTKATIKVPMTRNYEAIYTHSSETNEVHRFTQKILLHRYSDIQNFLIILKMLLYTYFGIEDVVVDTTSVTTLGETLS